MTETLDDPVLLTTDPGFRLYRGHGRQDDCPLCDAFRIAPPGPLKTVGFVTSDL